MRPWWASAIRQPDPGLGFDARQADLGGELAAVAADPDDRVRGRFQQLAKQLGRAQGRLELRVRR